MTVLLEIFESESCCGAAIDQADKEPRNEPGRRTKMVIRKECVCGSNVFFIPLAFKTQSQFYYDSLLEYCQYSDLYSWEVSEVYT